MQARRGPSSTRILPGQQAWAQRDRTELGQAEAGQVPDLGLLWCQSWKWRGNCLGAWRGWGGSGDLARIWPLAGVCSVWSQVAERVVIPPGGAQQGSRARPPCRVVHITLSSEIARQASWGSRPSVSRAWGLQWARQGRGHTWLSIGGLGGWGPRKTRLQRQPPPAPRSLCLRGTLSHQHHVTRQQAQGMLCTSHNSTCCVGHRAVMRTPKSVPQAPHLPARSCHCFFQAGWT